MKKLILLALCLSGFCRADVSFYKVAFEIAEETWRELQNCGLHRMDAFDPKLPPPQVAAKEAVVNSNGAVLAYTDEEGFGFSNTFTFKAPNGGYRHDLVFGRDFFSASTYSQGTIARGNRVNTVGGSSLLLYAGNNPNAVSYSYWRVYIYQNYTGQIVGQLCRFP